MLGVHAVYVKLLAATILALTFTAASPDGWPGASAREGHKDVRDSVVLIDVKETENQGTGWLVSPRVVVTAAHVVEGAYSPLVTPRSGPQVEAVVTHRNTDQDVAVLVVPHSLGEPLSLSCRKPVVDEPISYVGHPEHVRWGRFRGHVASIDSPEDSVFRGHVTLDLSATVGASGSPVLDSHDRVVGLLVAIDVTRLMVMTPMGPGHSVSPYGVTYALPGDALCATLR